MEIHYERQMRHNYLIIRPENSKSENYECHMLMANTIEGLLKFRFQQTEEGIQYYYEITSKQPLSRMLEGRTIRREEIAKLMVSIAEILERLESYLLQESRILLEPEYIYIDPEDFQAFLCFVPDRNADFSKTMEQLLQYLLKKVDHKEKDTVVLAYRLYQESQKEFYGMEDLLKWLPQEPDEITREAKQKLQEDNELLKEEMKLRKKELQEDTVLSGPKETDWKKSIFPAAFILLAPGIVWLIKGTQFFKEYPVLLTAWYGIWGVAGISMWIIRRKVSALVEKREKTEEKAEESLKKDSPWTVTFSEENSPEEPFGEPELEMPGEVMETRILTAQETRQKAVHYLLSLDKRTEDIPLAYFPFIIGKQSGIADFILNKDTVSRLHVKIEETENGYAVTDLNSTNGTRVRGEMLQNNETVPLEAGDEIYIADNGYRFI